MLTILIGVALTSPVLGRPLIRGVGVVYTRLFGSVGTLATQNSLRNPRRTAATASALMIGLTLVALMSILGQSAKASTDKAIASDPDSPADRVERDRTAVLARHAEQIRAVDGVVGGGVPAGRGQGRRAECSLEAADPAGLSRRSISPSMRAPSARSRRLILVDSNAAESSRPRRPVTRSSSSSREARRTYTLACGLRANPLLMHATS